MKKIAIAIATAALLFSTGCSDNSNDQPVTTVTKTVSPTPSDTRQSGFADLMRANIPFLVGSSDEDIVALAETICDKFDQNATFAELAGNLMQTGVPVNEAGAIIGGSIGYSCPEYEYILDGKSPGV